MKILMLIPYPNVKGPMYKIAAQLIRGLRLLDCEIDTTYWGQHKEEERLFQKIFGRFSDIYRIRRELKTKLFDMMIVQTSHGWFTLLRDIPLLILTSRKRPATILQLHGSYPERLFLGGNAVFRFLSRWLLSLCDAVMVLSSEEKYKWQQFCPSRRFLVVKNPFIPEVFDNEEIYKPPWDVPKAVPVLLFVGRLIVEKGIFELLEALTYLKRREVPFYMVVVGNGRNAQEFKETIDALNLKDNVMLAGYLEGEDLRLAYRFSDVFVLPTWSEGFPTVITEAMSAGLPIVTTGIRGVKDHLEDGVHALFVPTRDPQALGRTLETILSDRLLRERMARANEEKVRDFEPLPVARHYLKVIEKVVSAC